MKFNLPATGELIVLRGFGIGLTVFGLFVIYTFLTSLSIFSPLDLQATGFLQKYLPRLFDTPFSVISLIGTFEVTSIILVFIILKNRLARKRWLILISGFMAVLVLEFILKNVLHHPQPPSGLGRYDLPIILPTSEVVTKYAYPSGHMSRTLYLLIAYYFVNKPYPSGKQKRMILLLIFLGLVMGISRVYLGEHWLTDVVGGSLFGASIAYMVFHLNIHFRSTGKSAS